MATKEDLFAAVRLIKEHCIEQGEIDPHACVRDDYKCPLHIWCCENGDKLPCQWPEPADDSKIEDLLRKMCSLCGVCPEGKRDPYDCEIIGTERTFTEAGHERYNNESRTHAPSDNCVVTFTTA